MRSTRLLVLSLILIGCTCSPWSMLRAASDDAPKKPRSDEYFILGKDLLELSEKDPEAVILVGEAARKYAENARWRDQGGAASVIMQQCEIRGDLSEDLARLHLEISARSEREGRSPVPIALGEATLLALSIDGGPPFLTRDSQGWVAWVDGPGRHTIVAEIQLPVAGSRNLPALSCGIPEAPITLLELQVQRPLSEVRLTPSAPVTVRLVADSRRQLETALGPRNRLEMRWRWDTVADQETPPLVRAISQVTAEVEPGGIQIRTELRIQSLRGSQQTVELRNSPEERVLDLQTTDGKVVGWQSIVEGPVQKILLHYTEPLTGTSELVITSERPWTGNTGSIRGWAVQGAYSHWGQVALRSVPELDVAVTGTENAQATNALPASLRSPRNEAAFASYTQPYRLALSIQRRRAHTSVRSKVFVSYGDDSSAVEARWQFTVHGGKVTQVDFFLPGQFSADQFVFSEVVQAIREEDTPKGHIAHVFLRGTPDEFEVRLRAAIPLVAARNLVKLELPWPREAQSESSRLYLVGTADVELEPTPNFVANEDPADESVVKDFAGPGASFRAFECRSLVDQVAFRLSKSAAVLWHQTQVQLRLDDGEVQVLQSFEFTPQGVAPRQLRFAVPDSARGAVRIESAPGALVSDTSDELIIRLGSEPVDPLRVQLSYRLPVSSVPSGIDSANVVVPLISVANSRCLGTEVAVSAPRDIYLAAVADGWQAVALNSQRNSKTEDARWILRKATSAPSVEFSTTKVSWLPKPATIVQRAWIEVVMDTQDDWRMRSRFVLTDSDPSPLRVRIPHGCRLTGVRWDGKTIPAHATDDADTIELLGAVSSQSPTMLEIEISGAAEKPPGLWGRLLWESPQLLGDVVWGRVFWQIVLPEGTVLLGGPVGYCDENSLKWGDLSLRRVPHQDEPSLERWLTGSGESRVTTPSDQRFLYSRSLSIGPLQMTCMSRPALVLLSSGLVIVCGFLLVALPRRGKSVLVIGLLLAMTFFAALEPQAASECARSADWGLLLAVVAAGIHLLLTRRRSPKQSIFPEPAHLAKARSATSHGSSEFALVPSDSPPGSRGSATGAPRLAAPSSSGR